MLQLWMREYNTDDDNAHKNDSYTAAGAAPGAGAGAVPGAW